ncbi:hypothetical protein P8907_20540 [Bacillus atrophaeus]|uniref:hypothetical protein n=1 Tax=Bacillus atrophaeus TaxID=1452 RepID=UPI002280BE87|nr:hypothetical protein [Bacillus atrophaeus]MCY8810649.1 hypothetical protein [Bacillus atrophaeus]MCY8907802.1 hypothetical protein [Bacillus atrophaeus]MEC0837807.1 hypothetical protein [Bacillus atrophaeus]MEC0847708.1 hypothetical protein [Bacillus atrophaeus]MEC0849928.1 hypothetical protein [Bacillus atrophaeus]
MDEFSHFKLKIDAKPTMFHGKTVRKNLTQSLWLKKIRPQILKENNYTCVICKHQPNEENYKELHVHEIEEYDFDNGVVKLIGLDLICANCHAFQHFKRSQLVLSTEQLDRLIIHFTKVNDCSIEEYKRYRKKLQRSVFEQNIDRIMFQQKSTRTKIDHIRFAILGDIPFKDLVIERLKQKDVYYEYS